MGPDAPKGSAMPVASEEELWSEIIKGGNDDDDKKTAGGTTEALRIDEIIDGKADDKGVDKERGSKGNDEFAAFLDCLDKEEGVAFLSYFNLQQRQQTTTTLGIDNFSFLPAQRRPDSAEAVRSRIISGMSET
jgi:hypothetical protein